MRPRRVPGHIWAPKGCPGIYGHREGARATMGTGRLPGSNCCPATGPGRPEGIRDGLWAMAYFIIGHLNSNVIEAHCYVVHYRRIDCKQ